MRLSQDEREALQLPVSDGQPQGRYLKADGAQYRPLRNLFNIARTSLRKQLLQTDAESRAQHLPDMQADQAALADALYPVLAATARDLSLTGWFINSQLLLDPSLAAAEQAIIWFSGFILEHWEQIPPPHSDDEHAEQTKLQELALFFGTSPESCLFYSAVLLLPVSNGMLYCDYLQHQRRHDLPESRTGSAAEQDAAQQRINRLTACIDLLTPLNAFFSQRAPGQVYPGFFTGLLTEYRQAIMALTGLSLPVTVSAEAAADTAPETTAAPGNSAAAVAPPAAAKPAAPPQTDLQALSRRNIYNREAALHQLRDISLYFRRSEPHSPLSYVLEKAIRWGQMSLSELWQEILLEDNSTMLDRIFSLTGLNEMQMAELPSLPDPEPEPARACAAPDDSPPEPDGAQSTALRW